MNESSVTQRKEEILSALKESSKAKHYNVKIKPINGSGDMEFFVQGKNNWKDRIIKEGVIKYGEDITHLKDLFYK